MSGLHSLDGMLVEDMVGVDGSSLGSVEGLECLDEVVSGVSVSLGSGLSELVHVSSVGSGLVHSVDGLDVGVFGVSVGVVGLDNLVVGVSSVLDGLDVVLSGHGVVVLGTVHVADGLLESFVGSDEVVVGNVSSVDPDLADVHGVSHSVVSLLGESDDVSVGTDNSGVVSVSGSSGVDGFLEVHVPSEVLLVSPDSHLLASEVGHGLVTSGSLELHVFLHPGLTGGFGHLELSLVGEEGEVSEVVGSGTGGSGGDNSDLSEH